MHIREADRSDLALLGAMRLAFLAEHRGVGVETFPDDFVGQTHAFLDDRMRAGDMRSWLAEDGGSCVGTVSMLLLEMPPKPDELRTREGYLINMYVVPDRRRGGVGWMLVEACLAGAAALGVRRLLLHATADGRPMYERAGFEPNARWMELPR